jgi:5-methylcytosine-specific restriction endonuclease McrA
MPVPTADDQLRFLKDVQGLLEDGEFVATYKFALLVALADLAVESGVADDRPLTIPLAAIAEKFVEYYWQQSHPFEGTLENRVLSQNAGPRQAKVVRVLAELKLQGGFDTLSSLRRAPLTWHRTLRTVANTVIDMPLFRLQVIGGVLRPFLYPHEVRDESIQLNPGAAHHLRTFHPLVTGLARDRWTAAVRGLRANQYLLGQARDLDLFLFGSTREPTGRHLERLTDLQHGRCLYCERNLRNEAHVDHFIPWSLHRCDALPNLVAAHGDCNLAKRDLLAAEPHVARWVERNAVEWGTGTEAVVEGEPPGWSTALRVARWAYDRAFDLGASTWLHGRQVQPLSPAYRPMLVGG